MRRIPRPEAAETPKEAVMGEMLNFMAVITTLQEKLTSQEYKTLTDSAGALYKLCIEERNASDKMAHEQTLQTHALAGRAIEAFVAVVMRDNPWDDLTPTKVRRLVAAKCGNGINCDQIDLQVITATMNREIKQLVAAGRSDPGAQKKRAKK